MTGERLRAIAISAAAVLALALGPGLLVGGAASVPHGQCATGQQCQPWALQQAGMNASASVVGDNRFIVVVENAGYARSDTARVPTSIGKPAPEGELRSVEVVSGNRTGDYTIGFDETHSAANLSAATGREVPPVSGVETGLAYVAADSDLPEDAFNLTYNFDIDRDHLEYHQVSGEDAEIAVYRDGEWQSVPTEVTPDGGEVVVSASVSTADPVALGLNHGNLSVAEVSPNGTLVSNRTSELAVRVRNDGSRARNGTYEVEGRNDWIMTELDVTVPANSERTVRVPVQFNRSGTWPVEVGDRETRMRVLEPQANFSVANLSVENSPIQAGEEVQVVATVENTGREEGTMTVPFRAFGDVVGTTEVTLAPGETETVRFSQRIDAPGSYRVGVGNETTTVEVEGEGAETSATSDEASAASQAVSFWEQEVGSWALGVGVVLALLFGAVTVSRVFGRD